MQDIILYCLELELYEYDTECAFGHTFLIPGQCSGCQAAWDERRVYFPLVANYMTVKDQILGY